MKPLPLVNAEFTEATTALEMARREGASAHRILHLESVFADAERAVAAPIEAALLAVNGKAQRFTISTRAQVCRFAEKAEAWMDDRGIATTNRIGCVFKFTSAGRKPHKTWSRPVDATRITLRLTRNGWRLMDAQRVASWKDSEDWSFQLTDAAHAAVLRWAMEDVSLERPDGTRRE